MPCEYSNITYKTLKEWAYISIIDITMFQDDVKRLYESGKSMSEVADVLGCSQHRVAYWMKKMKMPKRGRSEAGYLKHNPNGDPFKIKTKLGSKDNFLMGLGLGIYLGEGSKTTKYSLRVANTDYEIIKIFRNFLLEICGVKTTKMTYSIIAFNDVDPEVCRQYWSDKLRILPEKFGKITVIPKQGKGTYKKKSLYGVCTIQISNIKLRQWMMDKLDNIKPD